MINLRFQAAPLWTPLAALLLVAAWLMPNYAPPWISFHKDAWTALVLLVVALVVILKTVRHGNDFHVDAVSLLLAGLGGLTLIQWGFGQIHFFGHALVGSLYYFGAAGVVVVGRQWEKTEPLALGEFLFTALIVGALGTAGLMLKQWLGVEGWDVWASSLAPGHRPYGNLMQPNNAGTVLLLGLIGLLWMMLNETRSKGILFAGGVVLVLALVLTQSRVSFISFILLVLGCIAYATRKRTCSSWVLALGGWGSVFVVAVISLPLLAGELSQPYESSLLERTQGELRGLIYTALAHALLDSPWSGYGFGQGARAQLAAAGSGYELPGLFLWSHNLFLDLGLWFGIPVMTVALLVSLYIAEKLLRGRLTASAWLYLAAIFVFLLHSMVELPHGYGYLLFPTCLFLGGLLHYVPAPKFRMNAWVMLSAMTVAALCVGQVSLDYLKVESSFYAWRFKLARVGHHHVVDIPNVVVLDQFSTLLRGVLANPGESSAADLRAFEQAVILMPSPVAMEILILSHFAVGDIQSAQRAADMARQLSSPEHRRAFSINWKMRVQERPEFAVVRVTE